MASVKFKDGDAADICVAGSQWKVRQCLGLDLGRGGVWWGWRARSGEGEWHQSSLWMEMKQMYACMQSMEGKTKPGA